MSERRIDLMPLAEVRRATRNAKRHALGAVGESIARFGVIDLPVIDERTERLVAGHGRLEALEAAHAAGEAPPDGVVATDGGWLVPVVRGWSSRSDADAEAAGVALNRLTEVGGWDEAILADLFRDYADEPEWLVGTGYDEQEVVSFLASLNPDTICRRFQGLTGIKPVLDATGEPHDFLS